MPILVLPEEERDAEPVDFAEGLPAGRRRSCSGRADKRRGGLRCNVGVDLVQKQDHSAVAVVQREVITGTRRGPAAWEIDRQVACTVRYLEWMPLGTMRRRVAQAAPETRTTNPREPVMEETEAEAVAWVFAIMASAMLTRREMAALLPGVALSAEDKAAVLTFDDAVKSHRSFVAPLLKDLGFGATFFITHGWMDDAEHILTWSEVAQIHAMGFEIGNHSWTHASFSTPKAAARLEAELSLVDAELEKVAVPKPVSFAWCGNGFCPEALAELERLGYRYARRGMQPEKPYGEMQVGPAFEPARHDRLLIPTTGDAYPNWTLEHFEKVIAQAAPGRYVVLQFHGVPDVKHPWVHTPPEMFEKYMRHLKAKGFRAIAMRDLEPVARTVPADPVRRTRYPEPKDGKLARPFAVENPLPLVTGRQSRIAPFPGYEHPRVGFLEGAIAPLRGTKAMAFLPWDPDSYVVIDVPEAIFAGKKLLFLAHTHIPTIWDERNIVIEDRDWMRQGDGLMSRWVMPDTLDFGASVIPGEGGATEMELWVTNKTSEWFTSMRSQVCVMLKRAKGFEQQTTDNKEFGKSTARVRSGRRTIAVDWETCGRTWGNPLCPCLHSDPLLPDCGPGDTVRVRGRLWFDEA